MAIKRALISVYDKDGIIELAHALNNMGVEILASGGTAKALSKADIPIIDISKYTGSAELFDGRVKTLHPKIHGGILLRRDNQNDLEQAEKNGIKPIDLVVVNLYPFEKIIHQENATEDLAIENIDIGGIALIRACAKNYKWTTILVEPQDYTKFIQDFEQNNGEVSEQKRKNLMIKAFERSSHYDWAISRYFGGDGDEKFPYRMKMVFERAYPLRYGENPHQKAAAYRLVGQRSLFDARIHSGKVMSYNNFLDADSALHLIREFHGKHAVAIVKHNNPCGVAIGKTLKDAYLRAYESDPLSAYGGVLAFSSRLDVQTANAIGTKYLEVILAPGYEPEALNILKKKPSRRILDISDLFQPVHPGDVTFRHISGGMLYQHEDPSVFDVRTAQVVTKAKPTEQQLEDMYFAMTVAKHTKSNAITIAKQSQILGVGAGQMSRVDSTHMAILKANQNKFDLSDSVVASDAFLPFTDTLEALYDAGITALIQPGGSINDEKVIHYADDHGISMVFTAQRHFKH